MPKLITTQTRIADLGKPCVIIFGDGFGGLQVSWLASYFSYDKSNRLIIGRPKDGAQ